LQNSEQGLKIKEFLDQCVLLKIGTIIENFSMRNQKGKKQSLHRVSAKYILLTFGQVGVFHVEERIQIWSISIKNIMIKV
jgi:hypothetical protein